MPLNICKGNMFQFVTHTFNTVKGKCPHDCGYCYMKRFKQKDVRFDKNELKTDLGEGNFIFVGSSCDMWAEGIPLHWAMETLDHLNKFKNKYLLQSKDPARMDSFVGGWIPEKSVIGTTIETNRWYGVSIMGKTPKQAARADAMNRLSKKFITMVTVEPVMNFDVEEMRNLIRVCNPQWVNIGADSKGHNLPEPGYDKIMELLDSLKYDGVDIKLKDNLKRLL